MDAIGYCTGLQVEHTMLEQTFSRAKPMGISSPDMGPGQKPLAFSPERLEPVLVVITLAALIAIFAGMVLGRKR